MRQETMRKAIYYIIILLIISCGEKNSNSSCLWNNGIDKANNIARKEIFRLMSEFYIEEAIYPEITEINCKKAKEINFSTLKIDSLITEIKQNGKKISSKKLLLRNLNSFQNYLETNSTSSNQKNKTTPIHEQLKTQQFNNELLDILTTKVYYSALKELTLLLEQVRNDINITHSYKTFVIPKKRVLKRGETFEAKIFLAVIDTAYSFNVEINNKLYHSQNGKVIYKKRANMIGKQTFGGVLSIKNRVTKEIMKFPFKAKYKVQPK